MTRLRVQFGGSLGTASDWSNTLEFSLGSAFSSLAELQTACTAVQTALRASSAISALMANDTQLVSTKMLQYPSNTGVANLVAVSTGAAAVGTASAVHAPQVCVAASLRTDSAGRSNRGRIFTPLRSSVVSALGVVNTTGQGQVAAFANELATAVVAACGTAGIAASWIVWSPSKSSMVPVTAVLVGNQCDTIRHRNRNRAEAYASYSVTVAVVSGDVGVQAAVTKAANTEVPFQLWNAEGPSPINFQGLPALQFLDED